MVSSRYRDRGLGVRISPGKLSPKLKGLICYKFVLTRHAWVLSYSRYSDCILKIINKIKRRVIYMTHQLPESLLDSAMPLSDCSSPSLGLIRGKMRNCWDFLRFFQRLTDQAVRYDACFFGCGVLHALGVSLDREITHNLPLSYRKGIRTTAGGCLLYTSPSPRDS